MANEQEAAAGLYSLLKANPDDDPQARPDPPRSSSGEQQRTNGASSNGTSSNGTSSNGGEEAKLDIDNSAESMRKLTEMLLQNRPVVDPLKNQGYSIITPHQHDILSGRGNGANQHPGNIFFRNLIHKYKHHYIHTGPSEKKLITKRIVEEVQQRNPPGRFLKQNPENELWDCLDIDKVLKKTGQALREKAPELKKRAREEYKMKITTSQESYFQNSRASVAIKRHDSSKTLTHPDYESMGSSMRFDNVLPPMTTTSKNVMAFPIQSSTLDALAYQTIPLAGPSRNDAFNMSNLTAVTEQVDPENKKLTEELISLVADLNSSLTDIFQFVKDKPTSLIMIKTTVTKNVNGYSLPTNGGLSSSLKVQKIKDGEYMANAVSPHPHDVLFHDGMIVISHPGSKYFCEEVKKLLPQYKGPVVNEKRVEQKIIAAIGSRWPPGRFLCSIADNNSSNASWHVLSFDQALQAISNHIRRACFEAQRILIPNPNDVLVIRGNSQHQGNIFFRTLIEKYYPKYETIPLHHARKHIAKAIVGEIEKIGGRFLKFNSEHNFWEPLEYETVMQKTLQGMRDHQKKKELQQKAVKPMGVVVPQLTCVKESVEDGGRNSDPPGVFYNYYSVAQNSHNSTLAIASVGNDPPGQVAQVANCDEAINEIIPRVNQRPDSPGQNLNSSSFLSNSITPRMVSVPEEIGTSTQPLPSQPVQFYAAGSSGANVIMDPSSGETVTKKRPHEMGGGVPDPRPSEKRVKLEP